MSTQERAPKKEREPGPLTMKSLKKIVTIMNRAKITELDIEQDGVKIHLRKGPGLGEAMTQMVSAGNMLPANMVQAQVMQPMAVQAPMQMSAPLAPVLAAAPAEDANLYTIKSPMVGTFYRSPSPEAKTYIEVGSEVNESSVICIVEAMKLMNEIKAEVKGVIKKILVENAQAVEFGQPLFQVERKG